MEFICCGNHLMMPYLTLTRGAVFDISEPEGQDMALAGRPIAPASHVDFEPDDSDESAEKLMQVHAGYRSLLQQNMNSETETKET